LAGGRVFETIAQRFQQPLRIAIMETPAGFELNSKKAAGRVGDFMREKLQNSVIPHWNNTDGGDEIDTSGCFIGVERFNQWCNLLPTGYTTVGLDEHTGLIIDFAIGNCIVNGAGSVTILRESTPEILPSGAEFPISKLEKFICPENPEVGISVRTWEMLKNLPEIENLGVLPAEMVRLVNERQQARLRKEWDSADALRKKMACLGWQVQDTPDGKKLSDNLKYVTIPRVAKEQWYARG
jgi:hypothetical protein